MKELIEPELLRTLESDTQVGKWKVYGEYKDSGVEWLDKVPTHWSLNRLKFFCTTNPSKLEIHHLPKDTMVSFLPMELIGEDGQLTLAEERKIQQVLQGYTYFYTSDVIVAKITPCFENGKGALCKDLTNDIGFGTTELHVLRSGPSLYAPFLYYITKSRFFRLLGVAYMTGSAGQQRVPEEFIKNLLIGIPSLPEQHTIVTFLDRETAKLNELIARKERMITLLQERRTAIINQAVTKGLNLDVPMKDSGADWLGEIPKHWEVRRLKYLTEGTLTNGIFKKKDQYGSGTKLVNVVDIYQNTFIVDTNNLDRVKANDVEIKTYRVNRGDIFFVRSSLKREGVGVSACIQTLLEPIVFECHLVRMQAIASKMNPLFLINYLRHGSNQCDTLNDQDYLK
jgi:restriction endonuclease S subunit